MKEGGKNIAGKGRMRERMDQILMHPSQEHLQVLSGGVSPKDAGRCHTGSSAFAQLLEGPQAGSIPGAVVLSCRESPVPSVRWAFFFRSTLHEG